MADVDTELTAVRAKLEELSAERSELDRAVLPLRDSVARVEAAVNAVASSLPPLPLQSFLRDDGPPLLDLRPALQEATTALLLTLGAPAIVERLTAQLKTVHQIPGLKVMASADRRKRAQAVEDAILSAEIEEERICRRIESSGREVDRRVDAPPAVVLMMEE